MTNYSTIQIARHLLMRVSMGFTLGWFGFLQLRAPESWLDFIPHHISQFSPLPDASLILIHGLFLVLSAIGMTLGIYYRAAAWTGVILLVEIIIALVLDRGPVNLIVRDIGLLGLGLGLVFDNVRIWQLDSLVPKMRVNIVVHSYSNTSTYL